MPGAFLHAIRGRIARTPLRVKQLIKVVAVQRRPQCDFTAPQELRLNRPSESSS